MVLKLFRGFSTVDRNHKNNKLFDIDLIKRDLLNQFHTRKGERVMYPDYGSIIWDMLFEPYTEYARDLIIDDATRIINSDSRVELQNLQVLNYDHGIQLQIDLFYVPFNAVGTFDIEFDRRAVERSSA